MTTPSSGADASSAAAAAQPASKSLNASLDCPDATYAVAVATEVA